MHFFLIGFFWISFNEICWETSYRSSHKFSSFLIRASHVAQWLKKKSICQCRTYRFNPWVRKIPWRRKRQLTPVSLLGKSHEQRSLVSYRLSACKRVGHNLVVKQQQQHSFLYTNSTALHMFP